MVKVTDEPIAQYFGELDDPRIDRSKRHTLLDIITIALCGIICGADSWVDIELFGKCKEDWFRTFLELPNGIPSHDTFGDVFARLDPEQFQRCFMEWVQAVAQVTQGEVVAIDGKTVRRSHDRTLGKKAIHMVNVWASSNGLALGQTKVDEKSNEITAIPKLRNPTWTWPWWGPLPVVVLVPILTLCLRVPWSTIPDGKSAQAYRCGWPLRQGRPVSICVHGCAS